MTIWFKKFTIDDCNLLNKGKDNAGSLMQTLGITISEITPLSLTATMPIHPGLYNPMGLVHGGVNVSLAETVASFAANLVLDNSKFYAVGQEINANHIRAAKDGLLIAIATSIFLGRKSSVWEVKIYNNERLTCISRMTASVLEKNKNSYRSLLF